MRAGIEPGKAAAELLDGQPPSFEIDAIGVGDLKLAARRRLELARDLDDRRIVEIKPGHRPIRFRLLRLFLDVNGPVLACRIQERRSGSDC